MSHEAAGGRGRNSLSPLGLSQPTLHMQPDSGIDPSFRLPLNTGGFLTTSVYLPGGEDTFLESESVIS